MQNDEFYLEVNFGKYGRYNTETSDIIFECNGHKSVYPPQYYLKNGRFFNFEIAVKLFVSEYITDTEVEILNKVRFSTKERANNVPWVRAIIAVSILDFISVLRDENTNNSSAINQPPLSSKDKFKTYVKTHLNSQGRNFINSGLRDDARDICVEALYEGMRCGLMHTGFVGSTSPVLSNMSQNGRTDVMLTDFSGEEVVTINENYTEVMISPDKICRTASNEMRNIIYHLKKHNNNSFYSDSICWVFMKKWEHRWGW